MVNIKKIIIILVVQKSLVIYRTYLGTKNSRNGFDKHSLRHWKERGDALVWAVAMGCYRSSGDTSRTCTKCASSRTSVELEVPTKMWVKEVELRANANFGMPFVAAASRTQFIKKPAL